MPTTRVRDWVMPWSSRALEVGRNGCVTCFSVVGIYLSLLHAIVHMPITLENRKRYPDDWNAIREAILARAKHCCEWCGVPNYAVGYRDADGRFVPARGNGPVDAIGRGRTWPNESIRTTYAEAKENADDFNFNDAEHQWIVIVLTIAHVVDDSPENCDPANLAALCQRCHNKHDAPARAKRRKEKRDQRQPTLL